MKTARSSAGPVSPGIPAPDFTLHSTPDQTVSLRDFRGRPVILAFYPADWSPVCGDQMALYNEVLSDFDGYGARLLGISVDGAWCHRAFAGQRNLHFPLLADFEPKGAVARGYGVYRDGDGLSDPATDRTETAVRVPDLPAAREPPPRAAGGGGRRSGGCAGQVLGDARPPVRAAVRAGRRVPHRIRGRPGSRCRTLSQRARQRRVRAPRAGRLPQRRHQRRERDADLFHQRRAARRLLGAGAAARGARGSGGRYALIAPGKRAGSAVKPGKIADSAVAPRCRVRSSANRSRKSVVTARSRPSNRCAGSRPGHFPSTLPPFTGPPSTSMAVACPWSVPEFPFSRTVRPNSDIVRTTTSRIRSPRSRVKAARARPSSRPTIRAGSSEKPSSRSPSSSRPTSGSRRSEEHTSELQSLAY